MNNSVHFSNYWKQNRDVSNENRWPPLFSRPPLTFGHILTAAPDSYDTIHGHYAVTWTPVYLEFWFCASFVKFTQPYVVRLKRLHNLFVLMCMGPKSSFISRSNSCPLNIHTFYTNMGNRLKFLDGNVKLLKFPSLFIDKVLYLLSNWTVCLCALNSTFAQTIVAQFNSHIATWF